MKSKWEQYKEKHGVTPLDLLNFAAKSAEPLVSEQRLSICKECPEFFAATTQCKKCGCFMVLKTKLEMAKCPLEKW